MQLTDEQMAEALRILLRDAWEAGREVGADPIGPAFRRNPYSRKRAPGRNPVRLLEQWRRLARKVPPCS